MTTMAIGNRLGARRGFLKWALPVLGLCVLWAAHSAWDLVEGRGLKAALDRIQQAGQPISIYEFSDYHPIEPRSRDAGPYYMAAATLSPFQTISAQGTSPNEHFLKSRDMEDLVTAAEAGPLDPGLVAKMAESLNEKTDALRLLDVATDLEFNGFEPGSNYSYRQSQLLALLRLTGLRTIYSAVAGDAVTAAASATAEVRLALHRHSPLRILPIPMMSPYASGVIARLQLMLNRTAPSEASLAPLASALAAADSDDVLTDYFVRDRATKLTSFVNMYGMIFGSVHVYSSPWSGIWRPLGTRDLVRRLALYDSWIDASKQPWPIRIERVSSIQPPPLSRFNPYGFHMEPPADIARSLAVTLAQTRTARVAVAVERFRRANGGQLPTRLGDIGPALLDHLPVDPFSGKPLLYRIQDGGYVVYSVGPDGRDDGGSTAKAAKAGAADLPADLGVRVVVR